MKTPCCASMRGPLYAALLFTSVFASETPVDESPLTLLYKAPLSLPRLTTKPTKFGKNPISAGAFEVSNLIPGERTVRKTRTNAEYLDVEPGAVWEQKLRTQGPTANYVSFTLNASVGTVVEIGGAKITIATSRKDPSFAAIFPEGTNRTIEHEMPFVLFGGARMAPLDIVTVQLDHANGTWAMWFRDTLVASDLPLLAERKEKAAPRFRIEAGKAGAWLCGLVCSDENPLFEDANDNLVPDDFEQASIGQLLARNASTESQNALRRAWLVKKQTRPPTEFVLTTPVPDSFPDNCSPEGKIVHGMTSGRQYGSTKSN